MCYNEQISLNTFLFSSFVLGLVIYNNAYSQYKISDLNRISEYVFIFSFIIIQLVEFFIWRNIHNAFYNYILSIIVVIVLWFQPIASIMMVTNDKIRNILLSFYTIPSLLFVIYSLFTKNINVKISKDRHLIWNFFNKNILIMLCYWLFFVLFGLFYQRKWSWIIFAISTLLLVFYNYNKDNTIWSMWCWIANCCMLYYAAKLLIILPLCELDKKC